MKEETTSKTFRRAIKPKPLVAENISEWLAKREEGSVLGSSVSALPRTTLGSVLR